MNRRSFLSSLARLGAAVAASPLAALLPEPVKAKLPYPNWRNYTDCYTSISREKMIVAMCEAAKHMKLMPPLPD